VNAAATLEESGKDVAFVLCGNGPSHDRLRKLAEGCSNVTLPGRIGRAEIVTLMERSVAGLVPYAPRWDFKASLPNKVGEYLSSGLPILTCMVGEIERLVTENRCGLLYDSGDAAGLANAIEGLVSDPGQREVFRESASRLFETTFHADRVYADYVSHLEAVGRAGPHFEDGVGRSALAT
jgi:colanic acid biosynthesis glycosyl transferase WcaI